MNKVLILVRGCPGSGKSTFGKYITNGSGSAFFEADQFFVDDMGVYNFDASKLRQAHQWCKNEVEFAMSYGHRGGYEKVPLANIVVSNTFTQKWEMDDYYKLAEKYGYTVFSVIVENRHGGVNVHGVPEDKLKIMRDRFQISL